MSRLSIGLLGCGTVGRGFVELVERERPRLRSRYGIDLSIDAIAVRNLSKERPGVDRSLLTTSAPDVIRRTDLVVEVIGGLEPARSLIRTAIALHRDVVTANKALLAESGGDLLEVARQRGVSLGFEASVCGGIPIIGALRRGLAGDSIESLSGILNGTCNYVLSRIEEGFAFHRAVALAQENGFAEADPALDLDGHDAAQKLRILSSIAFDAPTASLEVSGIRDITVARVEAARQRGNVLRQIATALLTDGGIELTVATREIAAAHPLARVLDECNALLIRSRATGELLLTGRGAGAMPTAAALLSDVVAIARAREARDLAVA